MRMVLLVLAATLALGLAACGDEAAEEPTTTTRPTPDKPDCANASRKLLDAIAAGLEVNGGMGRLARGYVVKSGDFAKVYIVAAEIDGPGLEGNGDVGV